MAETLSGMHVAVLMGGFSSEREVSLSTGAGCVAALERLGAKVSAVDVGRDVAEVLGRLKPDVALNVLHGRWGEDGCMQGVLEMLAIPYTHSGVLASALAMDKAKAKAVLAAAGIAVPGGGLFDRFEAARDHVMAPPYVVKPNAEGSSVGVFLVFEGANAPPQELAVAVMDEKALAVTEIVPRAGFYDFEAKYGEGGSSHVLPAPIPARVAEAAKVMAVQAHAALGCRGVTRSDFRYDDIKDVLVLLEVNTQPGMTPTSLVPEQAAHLGIGYDDLVKWIVEDASCPR